MLTLSIKNPWASLITHGIKPIENRNWKHLPKQPPQWLAIHASQSPEPGCKQFLSEGYGIEAHTNGAIIGAAYWTASTDWKGLDKKMRRNEFTCSDATVFLLFTEAFKIEPFVCKGRLGFWPTPEEAEGRILQAINMKGKS